MRVKSKMPMRSGTRGDSPSMSTAREESETRHTHTFILTAYTIALQILPFIDPRQLSKQNLTGHSSG